MKLVGVHKTKVRIYVNRTGASHVLVSFPGHLAWHGNEAIYISSTRVSSASQYGNQSHSQTVPNHSQAVPDLFRAVPDVFEQFRIFPR